MKVKREHLYKLREAIEQASGSLADDTAASVPELFPAWTEGEELVVGDRRKYNGVLYKVLIAHTAQAEWTPDAAPSLFARVLPGQDGGEIGEWERPDSTNPYMAGDKVTHNGKTWESEIDNNVWEPGVYGWREID